MNLSRQNTRFTILLVIKLMTTRAAEPERSKEEWLDHEVEQREALGVL
jgi:hypothetical protein